MITKKIDKSIIEQFSREELIKRIISHLKINNNTDITILRHQEKKKKRHKPIRKLFEEMPQTIQSLAPVLFMSPIWVSKYLPVDSIQFDVVIFDEASQITPWDAIGSIVRARQVIVVGDDKQLPPSRFFQSGEEDDLDSEEDFSPLESILEEYGTSTNMNKCMLKWHYRSQHESLIAFSNRKYYENELITFPSSKPPLIESPVSISTSQKNTAVYYQFIEKTDFEIETNTSKVEAKAVADQIEHWLSIESGFPHSIGIVTFNSAQQKIIEDLLEEKRMNNTNIDKYFSSDKEEPVIVKNLENIQGDERDIIIFSTGYGAITGQPLSMNFGPLNKTGGERRLNVAITRSRKAMYIFTALRHGMIDLNRTSAQGVKDLKNFLEYAEKGPEFLPWFSKGSIGDYESLF